MTSSDSSRPALSVNGLSHSFKNHRAIDDASFDVPKGSIHGFVGPNGAGKTTTLKVLATLLPPQTGRVRVCGYDVNLQRREVRERVGFMPDHFSMYRQMTVAEYLDFFGAAYGLGAKQRARIIDDVLRLTDMDGRRDDLIRTLSRGMQQRVSLARVLVNDPELLLLDEPASGLDPRARIELMEILRELRRMGKTIFISSHILSELADLCDSVTIIDQGRIRYSGPMESLLDTNSDGERVSYRITVTGDPDGLAERLAGIEGLEVQQPEEDDGEDAAGDELPEDSLPRNGTEIVVTFDGARLTTRDVFRALLDLDVEVVDFRKEQRHLNQAFMDLTEPGVRS